MELRNQARPNVTQQFAYYLSMSILSAVIGSFLFTSFWSLVDEDTGVLLFFFGLPMNVGASFVLMVAISQCLFQQNFSKGMLYRAGLLAAALGGVLAVCLPRIIVNFGEMIPDYALNLMSNWMVVSMWVTALLISSIVFPIAMRRER